MKSIKLWGNRVWSIILMFAAAVSLFYHGFPAWESSTLPATYFIGLFCANLIGMAGTYFLYRHFHFSQKIAASTGVFSALTGTILAAGPLHGLYHPQDCFLQLVSHLALASSCTELTVQTVLLSLHGMILFGGLHLRKRQEA